jgi:hypothetical protein
MYRATGHLTTLVIVGAVGVVLLVAAWRAGTTLGQSMFNAGLLLVPFGWLTYSALFLVAFRVSVSDGVIRWTAPLAQGERDVHELACLQARWFNGFVRLRFRDGQTVLVQRTVGFGSFARQLTADNPKIRLERRTTLLI